MRSVRIGCEWCTAEKSLSARGNDRLSCSVLLCSTLSQDHYLIELDERGLEGSGMPEIHRKGIGLKLKSIASSEGAALIL